MPVSKPYLDRLDYSPDGVQATLQWVAYLGETFGANAMLNCLKYYERIGWIGPTVLRQMTTYLQGLSLEEIHNKKYAEPVVLDEPFDNLSGTPFSPHIKSLSYIGEIADVDLEEHDLIARLAHRRIERTREGTRETHGEIPIVDGGYPSGEDPFVYRGQ